MSKLDLNNPTVNAVFSAVLEFILTKDPTQDNGAIGLDTRFIDLGFNIDEDSRVIYQLADFISQYPHEDIEGVRPDVESFMDDVQADPNLGTLGHFSEYVMDEI